MAGKILGIDGMTMGELDAELARGGKFVIFEYCFSIVIMTFKRGSDIHFVKAGESTAGKSIGFIFTSLLLGWWGIPWGPIYTIMALVTNFGGGKDVTGVVVDHIRASAQRVGQAGVPQGLARQA